MYKILSDTNQVLGYVDKPAYIKQTSGGYTPAQPVEAIGLNFQGTLYNLLGHSEIEGAPPPTPAWSPAGRWSPR